jgi:hypothetical protein
MQGLATDFRNVLRRIRIAVPAAACLLACFDAAALEWNIEVTPDNELFPVLDLSQRGHAAAGTVGDGSGLIAVRVRGVPAGAVRLTVETAGLRAPAVVDAAVQADAENVELRPRLEWDHARLAMLRAPRTQALRVKLEGPGGTVEQRELRVRLHPLDDALYYVRDGREHVDLGWVFAAYVDPHDAVVDDILAIARARGTDLAAPAMSADDRVAKVHAVWSALEAHGLRYAVGDPAINRGPSIYSQRVRLLSESWGERRANCIDSSVLIASVLERIDIPSFIVLVPGHAFVGFYTMPDRSAPEFLEATLLGSARSRRAGDPDTFGAARAAGRARWTRVAPKFRKRHGPDYALIDIRTAREYGTLPLVRDHDGP